MGQDSVLESGKNYGIPARTPASTSLWAHLLRKDTLQGQTSNLGPVLPPITPLDKNGTSTRILLYDTQAHLDRFSERADKLFSKVDETKREISIVNTLFQREHETMTEELVDLVNRSQTQLQNSIGIPAQTEQLERLSKDVNAHLEAINKSLDAIHSFNQTHSQMLQLQTQAIQSLQEQHGTVLAALLPLLPLLQGIPLHIESARNKITDLLNKPAAPLTARTGDSDQNCDSSSLDDQRRRSKRSSSPIGSDSSPSPQTHKKARITPTRPNIVSKPINIPSIVTSAKQGEFGSSWCGSKPLTSSSSRLIRQETTIVPSPRSTPLVHSQISAPKQARHIVVSSSPPNIPSLTPAKQHRPDSISLRPVDLFGKGSPTVQAKNVIHPLPPLFSNGFGTPSPDLTRPSVPVPRTSTRRLWRATHNSRQVTPRKIFEPSILPSSSQSDMSPAKHINPNNMAPQSKDGLPIIGPACHAAQHFSAEHRPVSNSPRPLTRTTLHGISLTQTPNAPALWHATSSVLLPANRSRNPPLEPPTTSPTFAPQQAKIREPLFPPKEGRRFIPLDDSDDDGDFDGNADG